jgi:pyruvate,orthophosphate dikinase
VVGAVELDIDEAAGVVRVGPHQIAEGDPITIDGTTGAVVVGAAALVASEPGPHLDRLLAWADAVSGDGVGSADERLRRAREALPH